MTDPARASSHRHDARPPLVYLAGPSVFRADWRAAAAEMKATCERLGAVGLYPMDGDAQGEGAKLAAEIRRANMELLGRADVVVAEMTPFRGPGVDGGTAYEMGAGAALGKVVVGWTSDPRDYVARVSAFAPCQRDAGGALRDPDGMAVEEFGVPLADNLMMAAGHAVAGSFEEALRLALDELGAKR